MIKTYSPKIKVCGITLPEQASALCDLKVEFIGINFVETSPRYVSLQRAKEISKAVAGRSLLVGIFMDHSANFINPIIESCGLDLVQLHGNEDPSILTAILKPCIKVFHMHSTFKIEDTYAYQTEWILLDTPKGNSSGGTGTVFKWKDYDYTRFRHKIFLAGGLGPQNLKEAVEVVQPYAVDLNSKIEISSGVKNLDLLRECIQLIR
jgi:phosphoribosylanthranilate isomerase